MSKFIKTTAMLMVFAFCTATAQQNGNKTSLPSMMVYKTKHDYSNLVAIIVSHDRQKIMYYPDPSEVRGGKISLPVRLIRGYLLDKNGMGRNMVFLKLTYQQYAKLKKPPTQKEMYNMIIDKYPLAEIYDCGTKPDSKNIVAELNKLIVENKLGTNCTSVLN